MNVDDDPRLPDFIVLGAHRCALRWLRVNLDEHPDIYLPGRSIDHFSDRTGARSLRSYRLELRGAGDARFVGECSPSYLLPANDPLRVAERIDGAIPDVRLVAFVRDPVERMFSAFRDHVVHGLLPHDADLMAMLRARSREVDRLHLVQAGRYGESLYPFWRRFRDRLLVVFDDELRDDPAAVYDRVLDHIGAPTGFVPRRLDWVLYSNAQSRWTADAELTDEQRRAAYMLFRADVEELEAMTGRTIASWDPGPPPANWRELVGEATSAPRSADAAG